MLNKFKLWFNKNSSRIVIAIIIVLGVYAAIKGTNNYYKNQVKSSNENTINTSSQISNETTNTLSDIYDNMTTNDTQTDVTDVDDEVDYMGKQYYMDGVTEIPTVESGTDEYNSVMTVMTKIMNLVYDADNNSDDSSLKEDVYNLFTDELLADLSTGEEYVSDDNVLDYIFYIEDLKYYSIGTIYQYDEQDNVARYGVLLKYQKDDEEPQYGFTIINMDYNNRTFSYDGTLVSFDYIDEKEITEIEYRGSNTF